MKRSSNLNKSSMPEHTDAIRVRNRLPSRSKVTGAGNADTSTLGVPSNKRTNSASRMSVMPNQNDNVKKIEPEPNNELKTLYHKYLQSKMESLIAKQKVDEREKEILVGLATLAKENEHSEQKHDEIKLRKIEMNGLNEIQNNLDKQFTEIKRSLETYNKKIEVILDEILLLLRDLDYLTCKNLKVPQVDEEMKMVQLALNKSIDIMTVLNQMIGVKSSTIALSGKGLKKLVDTHEKLEKQLKPLECSLRKLQIEILKITSVNLAQQHC